MDSTLLRYSCNAPYDVYNCANYSTKRQRFSRVDYLQGWTIILCVRSLAAQGMLLTEMPCISRVICIVTLVLTIMIAAAPPGLRNITAQYVIRFPFCTWFDYSMRSQRL